MITFIDHIGRVVTGKVVKEDSNTVTVNFPMIVHVTIEPETSRLNVQTYPYFFNEFIDNKNKEINSWTFAKSNIIISDIVLESRLIEQYERMANPSKADSAEQNEPEVIKLFD